MRTLDRPILAGRAEILGGHAEKIGHFGPERSSPRLEGGLDGWNESWVARGELPTFGSVRMMDYPGGRAMSWRPRTGRCRFPDV
jgi:hypothetical protein